MFQGYSIRFKEARRKNVSCRAFKIPPLSPPKCLTPYHLVVASWDLLCLKLEALSDTWPLYFVYCIPAFHLATTENGRRKGKCQRGMAFFVCWLMAVRLRDGLSR